MSRHHHVVVLFHHRLFGEAIVRLLRESERLDVSLLPADASVSGELRAFAPDAVVLEDGPIDNALKSLLLDLEPALTIVVDSGDNLAEIYEKHEVIQATAAQIIERITSHRPAGRAGAAAASRHRTLANREGSQ